MAVRELPRQNSETMERIYLFELQGPCHRALAQGWALYLAGGRYDSFSERHRDELDGADCKAKV